MESENTIDRLVYEIQTSTISLVEITEKAVIASYEEKKSLIAKAVVLTVFIAQLLKTLCEIIQTMIDWLIPPVNLLPGQKLLN